MRTHTMLLSSLAVIGGADGPTAVFVTGQKEALLFVLAFVGTVVLVALAVRFLHRRKKL